MIHASRIVAASCALFCFACGDSGQAPQSPPSPPSKETKAASSPSPTSSAWPGLEKDTALAVNSLARNYYLVFDASGSMSDKSCTDNESKLQVAKQAVTAFAKSIPADANVGLLVFGAGGIHERLPLAGASRDRLASAVASVNASAGTPLKTSIQRAGQALTAQARRQLGYGEYHLVVITDGEFTPSDQDPRGVVEEILTQSPIVIHTLGFCLGDQHSLNQGGRILYKAANSRQELEKGLGDVLAESPVFDVTQFK